MNRNWILGTALLAAAAGGAFAFGMDSQVETTGPQPPAVAPVIAHVPPPTQPLPYSHKTHAGDLGLECRFCHIGSESPGNASGAMMTFPGTDTCMGCHADIATGRQSIIRLTKYHEAKQPIPWKRVYTIVKGVNWSHRTHLEAGAQCETCHGAVSALEVMAQTTVVAAMSACISCHQASGASTECQTCHAWPTEQQRLRWNE